MDRELIIEEILKVFRRTPAIYTPANERILREALKRIVSDADLICLAQDLGINTDKVLSEPAKA